MVFYPTFISSDPLWGTKIKEILKKRLFPHIMQGIVSLLDKKIPAFAGMIEVLE